MTTALYAAYGSNLHPARLKLRVPSATLIGSGSVAGYDLRFHKRGDDGSAKCTLAESDGHVHVAVYEILRDEKLLLDDIEGVGRGYEESRIAVPGFGECWTYIAGAAYVDAGLLPYAWYKSLVLLGCEFNAFPDGYTQRVRNLAEQHDMNALRNQQNMQLVGSIMNSAKQDR